MLSVTYIQNNIDINQIQYIFRDKYRFELLNFKFGLMYPIDHLVINFLLFTQTKVATV